MKTTCEIWTSAVASWRRNGRQLFISRNRNRDWTLILPFPNTYRNAFETMCGTQAWPHVASNGKLCLYLKGIDWEAGPPQEVHDWIAKVGKYVAMNLNPAVGITVWESKRL